MFIDEVQKVPALLDEVHRLIEEHGTRFVLTGQAESLVRNLGGFARFLDVAAAQCGDILNFSAVARDAALAHRTVQEYFQILEDTLIGFRPEAWRKSPRARMVAHPRCFLFDTGVTNALNRRLGAELDQGQKGRLFEQLVVLETMRLLDYEEPEARLFYWRTSVGSEVDLLVELHGKLRLAVEIKHKTRVVGPDLRGLRSFHEAHAGVPLVAVARVPEPFRLEQVEVLPFENYAAQLVDRVRSRKK